jgi:hypothetical protein
VCTNLIRLNFNKLSLNRPSLGNERILTSHSGLMVVSLKMDMLVLHVFHSRWTIIPANAANIMMKQQYLLILSALLDKICIMMTRLACNRAIESSY